MSNELRKRVLPFSLRWASAWLRRDLASFKKRLTALERHLAQSGDVLTEAPVAALEKKQDDDVADGEIETAHRLSGQSRHVLCRHYQGVGRIYQPICAATYSKWAAAKLYTAKTPNTAADLLNDCVLPCLQEQGMGLIRVLTDRGTKYCDRSSMMTSSIWR